MDTLFNKSIAVTGGFASGKSTVAQSLATLLGYSFYSADTEVALLLKKNSKGWLGLREQLDPIYFDHNEEIVKPALRKAIFADEILRKKVEQILHPLVKKNLKDKALQSYENDKKNSVLEIPLLFETGWQDDFWLVVVVSVDEEIAIERAMRRDNITHEQALCAISAQLPLQEKILKADYVIDNNMGCDHTKKQLSDFKKYLDTLCLTP